MKKNLIIVLAIVLVFVIGGICYFNREPVQEINHGLSPEINEELFPIIQEFTYACDDNAEIKATFYIEEAIPVEPEEMPIPTGKVEIEISDGRNYELPQTISASGVRYANEDESIIFWTKGEEAYLVENDEVTINNCQIVEGL